MRSVLYVNVCHETETWTVFAKCRLSTAYGRSDRLPDMWRRLNTSISFTCMHLLFFISLQKQEDKRRRDKISPMTGWRLTDSCILYFCYEVDFHTFLCDTSLVFQGKEHLHYSSDRNDILFMYKVVNGFIMTLILFI